MYLTKCILSTNEILLPTNLHLQKIFKNKCSKNISTIILECDADGTTKVI